MQTIQETIPNARVSMPGPPMGKALSGGKKCTSKCATKSCDGGKKPKPKSKSKEPKKVKKGGDLVNSVTGLAVPFAIYLLSQTVKSNDKKSVKSDKSTKTSFSTGRRAAVGGEKINSKLVASASGPRTQVGNSQLVENHFNNLAINLDNYLRGNQKTM